MTTAACPRCRDEVTIPPGAPPHAEVRCPWCREEFELSEVIDRMPPMLEVISARTIAPSSNGDEGGFGFAPDESYAAAPGESKGEARNFDFGGGGTATAAAPARSRPARPASTARPKRKQKSAVAEVIKVVIGGVVGLFLAQLILWWLPEPYKRDPVELGPTVGKYVPWIVPEKYRPGAAPGGAANVAASQDLAGGPNPPAPTDGAGPNNVPPRQDTAGGDLASAFDQNMNASVGAEQQAEPKKQAGGDSPFSLGPDLGDGALTAPDDSGLAAPSDDPLEIPEPDLSLDPGAAIGADPLTTDPLADAAPSQEAMPKEGAEPEETPDPQPLPEQPADGPAPPPAVEEEPVNPATAPDAVAPPEPSKTETAPDPMPADPAPAESPKPEPTADAFVGVADAPMYPRNQVSEAIQAAQAAEETAFGADAGGDDASQQAYYTALTEAAEKITYADVNDPQMSELAAKLEAMLSQGNLRERAKMLIAHGAAKLSADKGERGNNGVALFGRVQNIEKQGALYETRLEMPGSGVIPVFSKEEPEFQSGSMVIVLGTLVDDPAKRLAGYRGGLPSVVWMGEEVVLSK